MCTADELGAKYLLYGMYIECDMYTAVVYTYMFLTSSLEQGLEEATCLS